MASLGNLLARAGRGIARIPRAVDDALTDEEVDPVTGKPIRRPSRIAQGLGEVIRAGVVAAGSPTPGAIGTAQDIFGGMKAVEQDRQVRQDRANNLRRQQTAEEMARQRNAREMRDSDAEYQWRQAQVKKEEALAAKANRQQAENPEDIKRYEYAHKQALAAGLGPEKAHAHGMAAMTRQTTGFLPNEKPAQAPTFKKPEEYLTNKYAQEMDALDREPELDPTFERGRFLTGEMQKLAEPSSRTPAPRVMTDQDGNRVVVDPKQATSRPVTAPDGSILKAPPFGMGRRGGGSAKPSDGMTPSQRQAAKVSTLIDRLRSEDKGGSLQTTLRNVMNFYQDDPEVKPLRSALIQELQRRIKAEGGSKPKSGVESRLESKGAQQPYTKPSLPKPSLPPEALANLKEGRVTTFGNGQRWTLKNGTPVQVQ